MEIDDILTYNVRKNLENTNNWDSWSFIAYKVAKIYFNTGSFEITKISFQGWSSSDLFHWAPLLFYGEDATNFKCEALKRSTLNEPNLFLTYNHFLCGSEPDSLVYNLSIDSSDLHFSSSRLVINSTWKIGEIKNEIAEYLIKKGYVQENELKIIQSKEDEIE